MGHPIPDEKAVERACRVYRHNADAANALGVHEASFKRMCTRMGIRTPRQRRSEGA